MARDATAAFALALNGAYKPAPSEDGTPQMTGPMERTDMQVTAALRVCDDCEHERAGEYGKSYCSLMCGGCGSRSPAALYNAAKIGRSCPHPNGDKWADIDDADAANEQFRTSFRK